MNMNRNRREISAGTWKIFSTGGVRNFPEEKGRVRKIPSFEAPIEYALLYFWDIKAKAVGLCSVAQKKLQDNRSRQFIFISNWIFSWEFEQEKIQISALKGTGHNHNTDNEVIDLVGSSKKNDEIWTRQKIFIRNWILYKTLYGKRKSCT